MNPKLYTLSDPDILHEEHTAVIPIGENESLDVKLIPYEEHEYEWNGPCWHSEIYDSPVNGKNWEALCEKYKDLADKAIELNQSLIEMIRNSNVEIKNDPRDN